MFALESKPLVWFAWGQRLWVSTVDKSACNCDGESFSDGRTVSHTKGCTLHGMCTCCDEALGVAWDGKEWACNDCALHVPDCINDDGKECGNCVACRPELLEPRDAEQMGMGIGGSGL